MRIILFFTFNISLKDWFRSGILEREIRIYKELLKLGYEVTFITYGDEQDRKYESDLAGIKLIPIYEKLKYSNSKLYKIFQSFFVPWIFRDVFRDASILKTNQMWGAWVPLLVKFFFSKPLLVRIGWEQYMNTKKSSKSLIFRILVYINSWLVYKLGNKILCSTNEIAKYIKSNFGVHQNKIVIRPNFIDTNLFSPNNKLKKNSKILYVGRLSEEKNIKLLLESISGTPYSVDLIGDGPEKDKLIKLSKKLDVKANFLGRFPNNELASIYNQYPVYVLCSKYEGNPKSLLEAMSCGLIVIGTDVIGINNIIISGKNGFLVPESSNHLRNQINEVMINIDKYNALGLSAREQIIQKNSLKNSIAKELEIYLFLQKN